jgi:hypothetical protein
MFSFDSSHPYRFAVFKTVSGSKIRFILRADDKSIFAQIPTLMRLLDTEVVTDAKYLMPGWHPVVVTPHGEIFLPIGARIRRSNATG